MFLKIMFLYIELTVLSIIHQNLSHLMERQLTFCANFEMIFTLSVFCSKGMSLIFPLTCVMFALSGELTLTFYILWLH